MIILIIYFELYPHLDLFNGDENDDDNDDDDDDGDDGDLRGDLSGCTKRKGRRR